MRHSERGTFLLSKPQFRHNIKKLPKPLYWCWHSPVKHMCVSKAGTWGRWGGKAEKNSKFFSVFFFFCGEAVRDRRNKAVSTEPELKGRWLSVEELKQRRGDSLISSRAPQTWTGHSLSWALPSNAAWKPGRGSKVSAHIYTGYSFVLLMAGLPLILVWKDVVYYQTGFAGKAVGKLTHTLKDQQGNNKVAWHAGWIHDIFKLKLIRSSIRLLQIILTAAAPCLH